MTDYISFNVAYLTTKIAVVGVSASDNVGIIIRGQPGSPTTLLRCSGFAIPKPDK